MEKTTGQGSADQADQHNDDRDTRIDRLANLVEKFLERDLRREAEQPQHPSPTPPPPVLPRPEGLDSVCERFQKLKPPTFEGGIDPKISENWLRTIERMFSYGRIPEESKVSCVVFYLREDASY